MPTRRPFSLQVVSAALALSAFAAPPAFPGPEALPIEGRWDVTVTGPSAGHPAWFEIRESPSGLAMRFVGAYGAAVDVPFVTWDGRRLEFQFHEGHRWRGDFNGRWFAGTTGGEHESWTAVRAPVLRPPVPVRWGAPVRLFDARTLAGWRPRHEGSPHGWTVRDGALVNVFPADDLVSLATFSNFKLSLQFRLQPRSDSGVHLRGRYEIQLSDRLDPASFAGGTGSIYGLVAATAGADCPPGQWNTLEATLLGREVTVMLNGVTVVDRRLIEGITGDALDSREGSPGPIVLQGYLGRVEYRHIEVTPAL